MPPSSTIALVHRFGRVLGLSEGDSGPTSLKGDPQTMQRLTDLDRETAALSDPDWDKYHAEVRALYLPCLLRTFITNNLDQFEAISPVLFPAYLNVVSLHAPSPPGDRFLRDNPTEAALVPDSPDGQHPLLPNGGIANLLADLLHLLLRAIQVEGTMLDERPSDSGRTSLTLTPVTRNRLEACLPILKTLDGHVRPRRRPGYVSDRKDFRDFVRAGPPDPAVTGEEIRRSNAEGDGYMPWWSCEARRPLPGGYPAEIRCAASTGEGMMMCGRCKAIRYCSPAHQKAHWKAHKSFCVAPTW